MKKLLLLHGALGSIDQFIELTKKLNSSYEIHSLNFSGHGGMAIPGEPFSMDMFAGDIISFLNNNNIDEVDVFGYSMGGYAALHTAINFPSRIGKIFTLATKFEWTPEIAERETAMLDAEKIKQKVPKFAQELAIRHGEDNWVQVLEKTAEMMRKLGAGDPMHFGNIKNDVLVGIGDRDKMVTLEETILAYRALPNAGLLVLPGTQHPLEMVDTERLAGEIIRFFE
jgi:pimeloyl-ACP methyl ester carboxylesterase